MIKGEKEEITDSPEQLLNATIVERNTNETHAMNMKKRKISDTQEIRSTETEENGYFFQHVNKIHVQEYKEPIEKEESIILLSKEKNKTIMEEHVTKHNNMKGTVTLEKEPTITATEDPQVIINELKKTFNMQDQFKKEDEIDGLTNDEVSILNEWYLTNKSKILAGFSEQPIVLSSLVQSLFKVHPKFKEEKHKVKLFLRDVKTKYLKELKKSKEKNSHLISENSMTIQWNHIIVRILDGDLLNLQNQKYMEQYIDSMRTETRFDKLGVYIGLLVHVNFDVLSTFSAVRGITCIHDIILQLACSYKIQDHIFLLKNILLLLNKINITIQQLKETLIGQQVNFICKGVIDKKRNRSYLTNDEECVNLAKNLILKWKSMMTHELDNKTTNKKNNDMVGPTHNECKKDLHTAPAVVKNLSFNNVIKKTEPNKEESKQKDNNIFLEIMEHMKKDRDEKAQRQAEYHKALVRGEMKRLRAMNSKKQKIDKQIIEDIASISKFGLSNNYGKEVTLTGSGITRKTIPTMMERSHSKGFVQNYDMIDPYNGNRNFSLQKKQESMMKPYGHIASEQNAVPHQQKKISSSPTMNPRIRFVDNNSNKYGTNSKHYPSAKMTGAEFYDNKDEEDNISGSYDTFNSSGKDPKQSYQGISRNTSVGRNKFTKPAKSMDIYSFELLKTIPFTSNNKAVENKEKQTVVEQDPYAALHEDPYKERTKTSHGFSNKYYDEPTYNHVEKNSNDPPKTHHKFPETNRTKHSPQFMSSNEYSPEIQSLKNEQIVELDEYSPEFNDNYENSNCENSDKDINYSFPNSKSSVINKNEKSNYRNRNDFKEYKDPYEYEMNHTEGNKHMKAYVDNDQGNTMKNKNDKYQTDLPSSKRRTNWNSEFDKTHMENHTIDISDKEKEEEEDFYSDDMRDPFDDSTNINEHEPKNHQENVSTNQENGYEYQNYSTPQKTKGKMQTGSFPKFSQNNITRDGIKIPMPGDLVDLSNPSNILPFNPVMKVKSDELGDIFLPILLPLSNASTKPTSTSVSTSLYPPGLPGITQTEVSNAGEQAKTKKKIKKKVGSTEKERRNILTTEKQEYMQNEVKETHSMRSPTEVPENSIKTPKDDANVDVAKALGELQELVCPNNSKEKTEENKE